MYANRAYEVWMCILALAILHWKVREMCGKARENHSVNYGICDEKKFVRSFVRPFPLVRGNCLKNNLIFSFRSKSRASVKLAESIIQNMLDKMFSLFKLDVFPRNRGISSLFFSFSFQVLETISVLRRRHFGSFNYSKQKISGYENSGSFINRKEKLIFLENGMTFSNEALKLGSGPSRLRKG